MKILKFIIAPALLLLLLQSSGCPHYNFTGGRADLTDTVTVSVMTFTNSAPLTKTTFPQTFSEAMRDGIQHQTRCKMVPKNGDLNFEGSVTGYTVTPIAVQGGGNNTTALNSLTVTVNVIYTDNVNEKYSFESTFTRYADFPSSQNLSAVEDQLLKDISDQLVQDILNRSINAW